MPRIVCTLENASSSINGISFTRDPDTGHMVSDEVADDVAASLTKVPGFRLHGGSPYDGVDPADIPSTKIPVSQKDFHAAVKAGAQKLYDEFSPARIAADVEAALQARRAELEATFEATFEARVAAEVEKRLAEAGADPAGEAPATDTADPPARTVRRRAGAGAPSATMPGSGSASSEESDATA